MTPEHLKAVAGWALTKRDRDPAYGRLTDAAGDVAGLESQQMVVAPKPVSQPRLSAISPVKIAERRLEPACIVPVNRATLELPRSCQDGGQHRFSIIDQRCCHCGQTYLQIKQRQPELM